MILRDYTGKIVEIYVDEPDVPSDNEDQYKLGDRSEGKVTLCFTKRQCCFFNWSAENFQRSEEKTISYSEAPMAVEVWVSTFYELGALL